MNGKTKRLARMSCFAIAALFASSVATCAHGGQIKQDVTLTNGWNAVYVSVAPEASADELFADWPVWSVSAYNADAFLYTASTEGGLTGEGVVRAPFWIWSRESPAANSLKSLQADSVLLCYSTNAAPYTVTLCGTPVAPRIAWHVSDDTSNTDFRNMFGVRLSGQVKASEWLAGCPAVENATLYYISGTSEPEPRIRLLARGTNTAYLNDGTVVFSTGSCVSDWSGPLYIMPRVGVDFAEEGTMDEISIRNDGAAEKTVTLVYMDSEDGIDRPDLLYRESYGENATADWTALSGELSRTVETGETWRVALALDRSKLAGTGARVGGIIRIAEIGGTKTMAWLPVSAVDAKSAAPWPHGLWVATMKLTKVSYYRKDGDKVDGVPAGGTMPVKVFLTVDADGSAKLVQRATVNGTRVSSAYLPVDLGAVSPASGEFGKAGFPLKFAYTIGATSPSNPFRHALHPLFDGKQMDFKTPAPDGDDFNNYVGSVKPEWFSIGGEVEFKFDENAATAWTPLEQLGGTAKWIYTGVRRDGPVVAEGRFTMKRVAKEAEIEE